MLFRSTAGGGAGANGIIVITYTPGVSYIAYTATGASTFTVPAGVTSITAECIGAGSGGGNYGFGVGSGAGGNGGAYAKGTLSVTPGQTVYINVGAGSAANSGAAGGDSWVNVSTNATPSGSNVGARGSGGGASGTSGSANIGSGGQTANCWGGASGTTSGPSAPYAYAGGTGGAGGARSRLIEESARRP